MHADKSAQQDVANVDELIATTLDRRAGRIVVRDDQLASELLAIRDD
jgi:hypothetical protein